MTTSEVIEGFWNSLLKNVSSETAVEVMTDFKENTLGRNGSITNLSITKEEVAKCRKCKNMEDYSHKTANWNTTNPDILVILERPNIGSDASRLVVKALTENGFNKHNASLTYLSKCYTYKYSKVNYDNCFGYLEDEISFLDPKLIVTCGKTVTSYILGGIENLGTVRGELYHFGSCPVLATYSPLYISRMQMSANNATTIIDNFNADFAKANKVCFKQERT